MGLIGHLSNSSVISQCIFICIKNTELKKSFSNIHNLTGILLHHNYILDSWA